MRIKTPKQVALAYKKYGSLKAITRADPKNNKRERIRRLYMKAVAEGLMDPLPVGGKRREDAKRPASKRNENDAPKLKLPKPEGRIRALPTHQFDLPPAGKVRRYFFTCAQNNTKIHKPFWDNLLALAEYYDAEIHVARFTYVKSGLGARGDKAKAVNKAELYGGVDMWWEPELEPYLNDDRIDVAPGLTWCGEMNILPTAADPLSSLESYTGRKSSIFPHTKVALRSVASGKHEPVKFMYTTGTITQRNYIHRKAGLKAEFHHVYGALLAEVDHHGNWWCRQINADSTGTIYDIDLRARGGKVTSGHRVDSIYWGDGHDVEKRQGAYDLAFGKGGMKDVLRPKADFVGDIVSQKFGSHHEMKDPHVRFMRYVRGQTDACKEIRGGGDFLVGMRRPWCRTHAVNGNHERAIGRWLKEQDGRFDAKNAEFWFSMQSSVYAYIKNGGVEPNYLQLALKIVHPEAVKGIKFLLEDESVIRCADAQGGIENGSHGDRGARGTKGTPRGYARMGRKRNIGDKHAAGIYDGVYVAGTFSEPDPDWTRGPSDWSESHIVTYKNGKRAIYTFWADQWAAGRGL